MHHQVYNQTEHKRFVDTIKSNSKQSDKQFRQLAVPPTLGILKTVENDYRRKMFHQKFGEGMQQ